MIKLLLTTLTLFAPFVSQTQVYEDFDTFQSEQKFNDDFSDIVGYQIGLFEYDSLNDVYLTNYSGEQFIYYAFPINYNVSVSTESYSFPLFYSNSFYNFYVFPYTSQEIVTRFEFTNYIGIEEDGFFARLNSVGMSQIIAYDKELPVAKTLYGSFFAFFTGFFPHSVVAEYNGIFTAIVVAFLLFLIFGFIFFLFRTIRRLMGFR